VCASMLTLPLDRSGLLPHPPNRGGANMNRLVSPLLIVLLLSSFVVGWRTTPRSFTASESNDLVWTQSMTLADNLLLVSDVSGLHIYDVSNLAAPTQRMRIRLHENMSSAVKDDIIYTNDEGQLKAIRLTGGSYTVVDSIGRKYPRFYEGPIDGYGGGGCSACTNSYDTSPVPASGGSGSSYATFAVIDNYLYRADRRGSLITYDITTPDKIKQVGSVDVGWGVESLYPTENFLFVGGVSGMYIFDRTQPEEPVQISKIEHTRSCDPVVVSGSTAFVTLRGSGMCGGASDELLCVTIKDPHNPEVMATKSLATPWGLATQGQQLYVSHGDSGYSLFDVTDPSSPALTATWNDTPSRDFIWSGHTLFVMSPHNVFIYDVTDPSAPVLLSQVQGTPAM